ncbi:hypothetical protein [Runella sp.]
METSEFVKVAYPTTTVTAEAPEEDTIINDTAHGFAIGNASADQNH